RRVRPLRCTGGARPQPRLRGKRGRAPRVPAKGEPMTQPPITAQMGLDARNALLWSADQWPRLKAALIPGGGNGLNGMPRHPEEHPAPFDVHVSDLLFEIETEARALAHVLLDETDDWTPTTSA